MPIHRLNIGILAQNKGYIMTYEDYDIAKDDDIAT